VYAFELFGTVLFAFLAGSVSLYLMLVVGVLSYHHLREKLRNRQQS
jgi:uncharacterized membrane protein YczE